MAVKGVGLRSGEEMVPVICVESSGGGREYSGGVCMFGYGIGTGTM